MLQSPKSSTRKMTRNLPKIYIGLAWALLIIGAVISIVFLVINCSNSEISSSFDYETTGQFGDYIGGVVGTVFALAGTIFVFASFVQQQHRNTEESFERNYYEMLQVHEDIVSEMTYGDKRSRDIFPVAIEQLHRIYDATSVQLEEVRNRAGDGTLQVEGITCEEVTRYLQQRDLKVLTILISVGVLYYGSDNFYLSSKEDDPLRVISDEVKDNLPNFGYEPMDNVLGHYYRQMYHTVKYVVKSKWLSEDERYEYVKQLRAQLSDYEQIMLYYNSMSINGFAWSLSESGTTIEKMSLIGRFRLIKNIPYHYDYFFRHPSEMYAKEVETWRKKGKLFFENEIYTM